MKIIPPLKPHFFKHILAGFNNGIRIPTSFSKYIPAGTDEISYPDEALLKKNGKEWRVKVVNEHFVGDGWRRFAEENELKSGGFIVFEHQGNMVFNAMIFHPLTQCGKEDLSLSTQGEQRLAITREFEVKKEVLSDFEEEEDLSILNPLYFTSTIKPYNIYLSYLRIPVRFARSSGLLNRSCAIIVKDEKERSWCMDFKSMGGESRIRCGCTMNEFFTANGFKAEDSFKLKLVSTGNGDEIRPVVRITPCMEPENRDGKRRRMMEVINVSESEDGKYPYFTSRIMNYSTFQQCLCIPMEFARSNGLLEKREMILMNGRGSQWQVDLRFTSSHFRIRMGWKDFRDDNGIKKDDAFKFEIIENGEVPVVRFTVMVPGSVGSG